MRTAISAEELDDSPRARVIRSLKQWITEGVLPDGQPLPSERTLSERLQVDRGTVRRALTVLDEQGLLHSHNGRTRIVRHMAPERSGLMQNAVAVLTRVTGEPWTGHRQSGWADYISHGAMHAIRQSGLHGVALDPERLAHGGARVLTGDRPLGIVVADAGNHSAAILEMCADLKRRGVPVVFYGDAPEVAGFDRVTSDHAAGSYLLTRWLVEQGRRHILPVWPEPANAYWLPFRRDGYERAMREAGLEPLPHLKVPLVPGTTGSYEARLHTNAQNWQPYLKPYFSGSAPVDALMLASDGYVSVAAEACRALGHDPNRDVALAGYDNYWTESPERAFEPTTPMVTIDKLNLKMGAQMVELLFARLEGRLPAPPELRVVAPELIIVGPSGT